MRGVLRSPLTGHRPLPTLTTTFNAERAKHAETNSISAFSAGSALIVVSTRPTNHF